MSEMIRFEEVTKKFEKSGSYAVDNVSFSVKKGEFITILGSSGCGKTTLLKMVNRLYEPDEGHIYIEGNNLSKMDAIELRRQIGYVIQQGGLFPHMKIRENMLIVPKLLKWEKEKMEQRLTELFSMIGLEQNEFQNRYPKELSGGQQQRIGLARAIAANPRLVLLDEPFGAIDAITRTILQEELSRLQKKLGMTMLFVTHDIHEAFRLGNRVMIMNEGRICQFDTPENIMRCPAEGFVEHLIQSYRQQMKFVEQMTEETGRKNEC